MHSSSYFLQNDVFLKSKLSDRVSHFLVKTVREYDWHHISLIVDETELANTLVKLSLQSVFKEVEFGHEIMLDIQSFTRRENASINYNKILKQSSRAARGLLLDNWLKLGL